MTNGNYHLQMMQSKIKEQLSTAGLRRLLRILRKDFPTKYPTEVSRRRSLGGQGTHCIALRKKIGPRGGIQAMKVHSIQISSDDIDDINTLFHEWAHALRREEDASANHDDKFWIIYGQIYRKYLE